MHFLPSSKQLYLSDPAKRDLMLIGEYTLREWGAVQKRKYLGQIKNSFKRIGEKPSAGKPRDDIDQGLMSIVVQKHVIFYRTTASALYVLRVLHESMDLDRHLS